MRRTYREEKPPPPLSYDPNAAAELLAILLQIPSEQRRDTLAVVCRVYVEGRLEERS